MYTNGLYSRVKRRLDDWLNTSSVSVENGDLALDLVNRGQERLEQEYDWEQLYKTSTLPIDSNRIGILPADCVKIIRVYFDPIGLGKALGYYSQDGDLIYGYKTFDEYSKENGLTPEQVQFFFTQPFYPTMLLYKVGLPRFTGQGIEHSFFSEGLLLRASQLEHLAENGASASEYQLIEREYDKALFNFKKQMAAVNCDYRNTIKDWSGNQVQIQQYSPDGGNTIPRSFAASFDNRYGGYTS